MSLKERYLDILSSGASLTALCDALSDAIGDPVALTIPTRTIVAHSTGYSKELIHEYTTATSLYTQEELIENAEHFNENLMSRKPFIGLYPYTLFKRINCGCFWRGNLISVLDIPLVSRNDASEELYTIIEEAAKVFTTALLLNHGIPTGTVDPMETYMIGLLRGYVQPEYQQQFSYGIRFMEINQWRAVWIQPDSIADQKPLSTRIYAFCARQNSIWCTNWADGMAILMDAAALDQFMKFQSEEQCSVVISDPFSKVMDFPLQLQRLQGILSLARSIGDKAGIIFEQKYKTPFFFVSAAQKEARAFYNSSLFSAIKEYEKERGNSDLSKTLESYLMNKMDAGAVAAEMNIHKNTVSYRLKQLTDLFGIDLKDCGMITDLYLAMYIEETTEA